MKFNDSVQEGRYNLTQWEADKRIIRFFSWTILANTVFLILVYYAFTKAITLSQQLLIWALYVPVSILVVVLAIVGPFSKQWILVLWYILITIASIMVAFGVLLRTFFCFYGIDPAYSCVAENRPISSANYSIIYLLLGPFLILNVMNNRVSYQIPAIVFIVALVIWGVLAVAPNKSLLTYFGLLFILGAQVMAIAIARSRERTQRARYMADVNNQRLSNSLLVEVAEKTEAQEKAKEEENRRTQFTTMLFHEMRVPLNSIILSINDLQSDPEVIKTLGADARETLKNISDGQNAIVTILNDSLDFRKMNEGKFPIVEKPFVYHTMVREVVRSMQTNWTQKGIGFVWDLDPKIDEIPYKLLGDAQRLGQVIKNYLSNAAKFTPEHGTITLKTLMEEEGNDEVSIYTHVQDTGIGIKKENQGKLFKPFVQIDPQTTQGGKGSGMGLSIVASIINTMGGTYGLMSEEGSIFWFKVTLKITSILKGSLEKPEDAPPETQISLKILVTDDEPNTRKVMRRLLDRLGHTTVEAVDGVDCLEKTEQALTDNKPFDAIFIDNLMPRMNGLEAIKILRERRYPAAIISLTGSGNGGMLEELTKAGADKVIIKPASLVLLKDTIYEISNRKT